MLWQTCASIFKTAWAAANTNQVNSSEFLKSSHKFLRFNYDGKKFVEVCFSFRQSKPSCVCGGKFVIRNDLCFMHLLKLLFVPLILTCLYPCVCPWSNFKLKEVIIVTSLRYSCKKKKTKQNEVWLRIDDDELVNFKLNLSNSQW